MGSDCKSRARRLFSAVCQRVLIVSTVPSPPGLVVGFEAFFFGPLSAFGLRASRFERFWPLAISVSNRGGMPRRCPTPIPRRKPDNSYQAKYSPAPIADGRRRRHLRLSYQSRSTVSGARSRGATSFSYAF